ncbi:Glutamine--fructose-6-phosphate aminotransferase [isomerizing] [Candidatus Brocadiaceae bacterium]|nr:Glutamine--fructose-6-phosphate aminotransferase [isomerizing] [Candidatus Brocadiaceae bacterium]
MGYYAFSKKRPEKSALSTMFGLMESRGTDASGFAYLNGNRLVVHKAAERASELLKGKEWLRLDIPQMMLFHTRLKTQGSELNNANNHPLFTKAGLCIVHNGMIHNDEEIFAKKRRDAEVDSEAILAILSVKKKGDRIKDLFESLDGSFAIGIIDAAQPDKLTLVKKDNPIELYYDAGNDILYFCSERSIMQQALGTKYQSKRGFRLTEGNYFHYQMENNHCLILGKEGVELYMKYRPRNRYQNFYEMIECPYCLSVTEYNTAKLRNICEHCGKDINEEDFWYV